MKIYDLIKKDIPNFFKNIWLFRKALWAYRWWDYSYTLIMLKTSIEIMEKNTREKGLEVEDSRLKKCYKMRRVVYLINQITEDNYLTQAEEQLGYSMEFCLDIDDDNRKKLSDDELKEARLKNKKIIELSDEMHHKDWNELWEIFKGQNPKEQNSKHFDGSGMNTWWD